MFYTYYALFLLFSVPIPLIVVFTMGSCSIMQYVFELISNQSSFQVLAKSDSVGMSVCVLYRDSYVSVNKLLI